MYGMSIKAYWANTVRSTVLLLLVVFEEISHFIHGVFKILKLRKINYPEMVRLFPVEQEVSSSHGENQARTARHL